MTENEMVGCYCRNNGQQFELTPGDTEEQGSLACFCPWDCKEQDTTEQLNNNNGWNLKKLLDINQHNCLYIGIIIASLF